MYLYNTYKVFFSNRKHCQAAVMAQPLLPSCPRARSVNSSRNLVTAQHIQILRDTGNIIYNWNLNNGIIIVTQLQWGSEIRSRNQMAKENGGCIWSPIHLVRISNGLEFKCRFQLKSAIQKLDLSRIGSRLHSDLYNTVSIGIPNRRRYSNCILCWSRAFVRLLA
jgi:hypothetical protein